MSELFRRAVCRSLRGWGWLILHTRFLHRAQQGPVPTVELRSAMALLGTACQKLGPRHFLRGRVGLTHLSSIEPS
jgi:hypothetical protein